MKTDADVRVSISNCVDGAIFLSRETSFLEVDASSSVYFQSLETYVDSAISKYVVNTLTEVSTRLAEQQKQIEQLLAETTENAVRILDESSKFEETHLRRLKEIENVVASQSVDRQKTTLAVHSDLETIQAQVRNARTLSEMMGCHCIVKNTHSMIKLSSMWSNIYASV